MMITASRNEGRFRSVTLRQRKTEDIDVKSEGALQIGYFEVDMADPDPGMNGW